MRTVRDDLSCTSVLLIESEVSALVETARIALDAGLDIVIRPQLANARPQAVLDHLPRMAAAAEELRLAHRNRVTLLVGTEFSLTTRGIVPGPHDLVRLALILRAHRLLRRRINRRVDALLGDAAAVARAHFAGPVGYGAATWESVDHSPFDFVGVNLYRTGTDREGYRREVRDLVSSAGKPVVVTEFGCGAQVGGDRRGPGSFRIVNWFADPPRVKDGNSRDEAVQADYLEELIGLYAAEGVDGCFVFTFCMTDFPHHEETKRDLDMAGFGIVAVSPEDPSSWRAKEAFHTVAQRYAELR